MKIGITGASGLVGQEVGQYFAAKGHEIISFVRKGTSQPAAQNAIQWDIKAHDIDFDRLEGLDVVIHLAGANIAGQRWTKEYKQILLNSRVEGTRLISQALAKLKNPPKVLLSASAVGYYGPHDSEEVITEKDGPGDDFLAEICVKWEQSTQMAEAAGIRVVHMRFGTVLDPKGGALAKMLPIFKLGAGGKLGSGRQMFPWILLKEIPQIINFLIIVENIRGPVNIVSPDSVNNKEYTKILGEVIQRPTIFPVPSFGLRLLYGEMADALLLRGAQVKPHVLLDNQYVFEHADLQEALETCLT